MSVEEKDERIENEEDSSTLAKKIKKMDQEEIILRVTLW